MDAIIRLNVGGTLFMTSESTLTWPGADTFFGSLLHGRIPSSKDESGAYFIDRDPKLFAVILNYLRSREVRLESSWELSSVRNEAIYFGITQLVINGDVPRFDLIETAKRLTFNDKSYKRRLSRLIK